MITRTDIINYLIKDRKLKSYLEIGVDTYFNFDKIVCPSKICVDPGPVKKSDWLYNMTSDDFFKMNVLKYDLIFIDGLHHSGQVEKDIVNSLKALNPGGFIVLHDCSPKEEIHQKVPRETRCWNGDVWRAFVGFRQEYPEYKSYCIDTDFGCGVIEYGDAAVKTGFSSPISYKEFSSNRKALLGLIAPSNEPTCESVSIP